MCFNKETSFISFFFAFILSIKMFLIGDNVVGAVLLALSLVQLNEFFLWIYLNNHEINHYLTILLAFVILIQPIIITAAATPKFIETNQRKILFTTWEILLIFFFGFLLGIIELYTTNSKYDIITQKSDKTCRLLWGFTKKSNFWFWKNILMNLCYILVFYFVLRFTGNMDLFYVSAIGLGIALLYNWSYGENIGQGYGSMWCFIGNLLIAFVVMTRLIANPDK